MNQIVKNLFILVIFGSSVAFAGLFRFESETLFSDRQDNYLRRQMPILETIQSSYVTDSNSSINTNFSFFGDPYQKQYNFELHSLNGVFKPSDSLQIQIGRSFNTFFLVRATTSDSVALTWRPNQTITLSTYGGLQQQTELQTIDIQTELSGASAHYQSARYYPLKFQTAYEHLYYKNNKVTENIGKVAISKQFQIHLEPEFAINNEFDINSGHQNRFDTGLTLYPSTQSIWNIRYLQYELNPQNGWEDPISTVIGQGRIDEGSLGFSYFVNPQISYSVEIAGDQYKLQEGIIATGGRGAFDIKYRSQDNLTLSNQIQRIQSYGGSVWTDLLQCQIPIYSKSNLLLNNEYVTYEKITSSKRDGISTQIGAGTWMWKRMKLNFLAEYNRNNFVQDEFKLIGQLLVMDWVEL